MSALLRIAASLLALLTLITGLLYPLAMTGVSQLLFRERANGSLVQRHGETIGSSLIGQSFESPGYFWSRPSATTPTAYNAGASTGSNLGPTNPALRTAVEQRIVSLRAADLGAPTRVPVDLVTASASGLDPHISPAAAFYQVGRIARVRGIPAETLRQLVTRCIEPRSLGVLGEARVNVLRLNIALDEMGR